MTTNERRWITVTCFDRVIEERTTYWCFDNHTLICTQHVSEQPYDLYGMRSAFCTVALLNGTKPLDIGTSSHANAIRAYITRYWNGTPPYIQVVFDV